MSISAGKPDKDSRPEQAFLKEAYLLLVFMLRPANPVVGCHVSLSGARPPGRNFFRFLAHSRLLPGGREDSGTAGGLGTLSAVPTAGVCLSCHNGVRPHDKFLQKFNSTDDFVIFACCFLG